MGQYDGFGFEDENENQNDQSASALRKAHDAAVKKAQEMEAKMNELAGQLSERNLKDVLQQKDLNPGLAKWMSKDGVDGSDESKVDAWLTENAALIGYKPKESADDQGEPDARADAFNRMQSVQQNAMPAGKLTEALSQINSASDIAEVNAILKRAAQTG